MDGSTINMIDLRFLSNPLAIQKMNKKEGADIDFINKKEIDFYKIRIFNMAKEILQHKEVDPKLTHSFYEFAQQCIHYFKFIDKSDQQQNEYEKNENNEKKMIFTDISNSDFLMMKDKKIKIPKITDYIKIKTHVVKKTIMPKERNTNLQDPKYKTKGIKKIKKNKKKVKNKI
jgi:hypothetical protein